MMNVRRATAAEGRLRVDFDGLLAWRDSFSAKHSSVSLSSSRNLSQVEIVLKRIIPILIVAFLAVVAASHFFGMVSEYSRTEAAARHSTALAAATAAAAFADADQIFEAADAVQAQARLARFLPQDRLDDDAFVLLVQPGGKVFAATAAGSAYLGASVGDFFSEISAIRRFGDRAGAKIG